VGPRSWASSRCRCPRPGRTLAIGLLDEIVEAAGLVGTAIGIVHRWTPPGGATAAHLALLRPPLGVIERAMAAETAATRAAEADGLSPAGISRFLSRPRAAELDQAGLARRRGGSQAGGEAAGERERRHGDRRGGGEGDQEAQAQVAAGLGGHGRAADADADRGAEHVGQVQ
jgi:hypothetical protein